MEKLTASLEDYLEVIYNYLNSGSSIRAIDVSKELNISRASATEALKRLAQKGYINYGRYETISLTELGESFAKKIVSKHTILQNFFEKVLMLDSEEASVNACKIEHVITENAFEQIKLYMDKH